MLLFGAKNIQECVNIWNKKIPIDKWYRRKYNIPFNSDLHKNVSFIDMYFDFYEYFKSEIDRRKNKIKEEREKNIRRETRLDSEEYIKGKGNFMKEVIFTQKDIDEMFDNLDIDSI